MMLNDDDDMEEVNCPQVNDTTTKTRRASIVWIILLQTWMMLLISRLLVVKPSTQVLVVVVAAFDRICFLQLLQIWVIESVVCVVCTLIYFCCSGCWLPAWLTDCWESRWRSWLTLPCHVFLSGKLLLFRARHLCCMRITDHSGEFVLYSIQKARKNNKVRPGVDGGSTWTVTRWKNKNNTQRSAPLCCANLNNLLFN